MIPLLMIVFAIGGSTYGMAEESLAFYALVITVMIAAGYDALTGAAIVLLGCGIGTLGSTINPFATGIASGFAGIPISDGLIGRLIILIVGLGIGIFFVYFMGVIIAACGALIVYRLPRLRSEGSFESVLSREVMFLFNNWGFVSLMVYAVSAHAERRTSPRRAPAVCRRR